MRNFQRAVYVTIAIAVLIVAVSLVQAQLTYGHHVDVPVAASDIDALGIYVAEYTAQKALVVEAHQRFLAATSAVEASDIGAEIRMGLEATLEHLDGLDVRECFATLHALAIAEFEAVVRAYIVDGDPAVRALAFNDAIATAQAIQAEIGQSVLPCAAIIIEA